MRSNPEDIKAYHLTIETLLRLRKASIVPADNYVWDLDLPPYVELNPAGAVDILLPAGSVDNAGICYLVSNISASTITFKTVADNAFTTAIVLATMENAWIFCTGSTTEALAWRGTATAPST